MMFRTVNPQWLCLFSLNFREKSLHMQRQVLLTASWEMWRLVPTSAVTAFYKGESQEKKLLGDWKEQRFLPGSPAQVLLGGSWGLLFSRSHVVVLTTPSVSDATSSAVAEIANHGSI
jgi:hypothetical protein